MAQTTTPCMQYMYVHKYTTNDVKSEVTEYFA
jgi:hypothetical protein